MFKSIYLHRQSNNNRISQIIPMCHYVKNYFKNNIIFPVQKLIAITIVFHIYYQCAIISVITLNIPSHGWNSNRLLRHFIPYLLLMININAQIIFSQKLIATTILFHKSYQCAIMSEINFNITLHGSNCNRLLRHFIP